MKKTLLVILSTILLLGILTGCVPAASNTSTPPETTNTPTINVSGEGQVTITPDVAYINIGVHTEGADVSEAMASNTQQAQKVSDALVALGVDKKDIQTTAFNVYPQQQYGPNGEMLDIKYVVDNSVYVTVRDLTKMGDILNAVVKSGANNINGIQFDVADRSAALSDARKKAVDDAHAQATELAIAAGTKLGKLQYLTVTNTTNPVSQVSLKGDAASSGGTVPVSAGQLILTVNVSATYELQ
jgi:uncharacterized protein